MENKESLQSLVSQGFIPQEGADGTEIFATGGETLVGTDAGVKYLLRFGEAVTDLSGVVGEEAEETSGLRRYLLVSAVLGRIQIPVPRSRTSAGNCGEMQARKQAQEEDAAPSPSADTCRRRVRNLLQLPKPFPQQPRSKLPRSPPTEATTENSDSPAEPSSATESSADDAAAESEAPSRCCRRDSPARLPPWKIRTRCCCHDHPPRPADPPRRFPNR